MPISITLKQVQFSYEADFFPPVLEVVSPRQVEILREITQAFNIKLGEISISPQNLGRGHVIFRRWFPDGSSFDVSLGADGLSFNHFNFQTKESGWEPLHKLIEIIRQAAEIKCEKQSLKFQGHCATIGVSVDEIIAKYNVLKSEILIAKGATFTFNGPQHDSQTFFVLAPSLVESGGIFLLAETTYFQEGFLTKNSYDSCIEYLRDKVLPLLEIELVTK
jgi:hypothetical protein